MNQYCNDKPRIRRGELQLLPKSEIVNLANIGKALSEPIRLQMVYLMGQCPNICTCEFMELLGMSQSKVSYHLKILLEAGIVNREIHGTWSHYSLSTKDVLEKLKNINA